MGNHHSRPSPSSTGQHHHHRPSPSHTPSPLTTAPNFSASTPSPNYQLPLEPSPALPTPGRHEQSRLPPARQIPNAQTRNHSSYFERKEMGNTESHESRDKHASSQQHHEGSHGLSRGLSRKKDREQAQPTPPQQPQQPQQFQQPHSPDHHSNPVQVPGAALGSGSGHGRQHAQRGGGTSGTLEPSGPPQDVDYVPLSNLNYPPRLPLPIQEEVYTPGSPIITHDDLSDALRNGDADEILQRHTSLLSHTTEDEDGTLDLSEAPQGTTVPTLIEWRQPGNRVYVTGSFTGWSKKYRMHRNPETNVLRTTLDLTPGTHHVKFIVDGDMKLSQHLPTAVDYTNILVNYIEVSADDIPKKLESTPKAVPLSIKQQTLGLHPPLVLPPGIETNDFQPDAASGAAPATVGSSKAPADISEAAKHEEEPKLISTTDVLWGTTVPQYLLDLDRGEYSHRFQRAANHVSDIPTPPSLPLFLSKSILNGTMPMKDDNSVLNMPNHTVLNHLATSSIKNEVLATSLTTRYKRKYVTTIIYRPTDDGKDIVKEMPRERDRRG